MEVTRARTSCRAAVLTLALLAPPVASAQVSTRARASDAAFNIAIGGATGAITAAIHGQSVWTGAWRGLAGGSVMSAARQLAGNGTPGAGITARGISAVGVSLIAAGGDSAIHYLIPVGPATIVVLPGHSVDWRLNVTQAVATIALFASPNTRFDAARTLYSGAPVFADRRPHFGESGDKEFLGAEELGTIRLAPEAFDPAIPNSARALRHETIHVLQEDYLNNAVTLPIERAVLRTFPLGRLFARHLDVGLLTPEVGNVGDMIFSYEKRPWEQEARSLSGENGGR